ncbi:hypothetical protein NEPAR08_0266 [Nematocida parisii]|nr:hypothetical protein NEPAR08_0266 [Nematocida parisii]KAI5126195.1 hypothetical protein NEPAR03_0367 [Nematocida parisii]
MDAKEQKLRNHIAKEFSEFNGKSMPLEEIQSRTIRLVLNGYRRDSIFNEKYPLLNNLAYNTFASLLSYNMSIIKEFNEDCVIGAVKESIRLADILIDSIERGGLLIPQGRQRSAFYSMLDKMHIFSILPASFLEYIRKDIFYAFCSNPYSKSFFIEEISSNCSLRKLCEINEFENCSNLDRVLDILAENIGNFTIYDNNGILQSNLHNLNLSDNDMYLLQLFASCSTDDLYDCISILQDSIFIRSKKVDEKEIKNGFKKSHLKRMLSLPIINQTISFMLEFLKKIPSLEKRPMEMNSLGNIELALKTTSKIINVWGFSYATAYAPNVKQSIDSAICACLPIYISFYHIFFILFSFADVNQFMSSYTGIINSIIRLGIYTLQEYEVYISYNEETQNKKVDHLYFMCDIDIEEFKKNVIETRRQTIKNQLDAIFSSPINLSLGDMLNKSLEEIEAPKNKALNIKTADQIVNFLNLLSDIKNNEADNNILINVKNIEHGIDNSAIELSDEDEIFYDANDNIEHDIDNSAIELSDEDEIFYDANDNIEHGIDNTHGLWKIPSLITRNMGISLIVILVLASLFVLYRYEIIMFAEWITFS